MEYQRIETAAARGRVTLGLLALGLALSFAPPAAALILPPEAIVLTQIHVQFEWESVVGATGYELSVVVDNGAPDPFLGASEVVNMVVSAATPRAVATSGLSFGNAYAWRVRGDDGAPMPWGPTHRFQIAALDPGMPTFSVTTFGGPIQPGYTLFGVRPPRNDPSAAYLVVIDSAGNVIWYLDTGGRHSDVRLLDSGRLLYNGSRRVFEILTSGQVAWKTRDDPSVNLHHEAFPMPNGDVLSIAAPRQDVDNGGEIRPWIGDEVVIIDRDTNDVVWSWNTFDHVSTLDYDVEEYTTTSGDHDWTHANSAIYNPVDGDIYFSIRHLNRIVRIDYPSGNIVYNMGFNSPSGDDDFGHDLFSFQHAPELLANGNMMVYDNGNRRGGVVHDELTGVSKAIELSFTGNPPTGASIVWEWTLPAFTGFVGDADRQPNGNTLVTAGAIGSIHEVDAAGSETWRMEVTGGAAPSYSIYRAERIDALVLDVPGDSDGDGLADLVDNCPDHANFDQLDTDGDGFGNVCAFALGVQGPVAVPMLPAGGIAVLALSALATGASWLGRRSANA